MATKKAKGTKKQEKGQSGTAWPTLMGAVNSMDKQVPSYQPGRAPKPKPIRISPKMPRLR